MAVSIAQYVDLLFKKLQGVTKTANSTVKSASNESIASPAFLRGDIIWMESNQIPVTAQAVTGIANARINGNSVQCVADTTVPPIGGIYPTWLSNVSYWIPQELGATWLPKVYVGPSAAANIQATGTQIFSAGISGVGEYYFDTQAGVLNFIGETIPTVLTAGNVVYISGYQYVGDLGVSTLPGNTTIGNIKIANTTITTDGTIDNINIEPTGNGIVLIDTTTGIAVPVGNTDQRPSPPVIGTTRFNTTLNRLEVYNGNIWLNQITSGVSNQTLNGDNSTTTFTVNQITTSAAILVMLNGVTQVPNIAYVMSPEPSTNLVFTEAPAEGDVIDIRFL
jgi:hypothetical protein